MATRKRKSGKSKTSPAFELTRVRLLYGLSGAFTLCVVGLLLARPSPLAADRLNPVLAASAQNPIDIAIGSPREIDRSLWKSIVIERCDSLGSATFHFAILPQDSGDQIAVSAEWSRQSAFRSTPGELRVALVSADPSARPQDEKTIRLLVDRLRERLVMDQDQVVWQ